MRSLSRIVRYLVPYKGLAFLSILFVILSAFFSLFSLALVAPFLKVLFGETDLVTQPGELALTTTALIHYFNYILILLCYGTGIHIQLTTFAQCKHLIPVNTSTNLVLKH